LAPEPYRGKRNEPSYVIETARVLAVTRNMTLAQLAELTTANFLTLFHKAAKAAQTAAQRLQHAS
jgi:TatD DNase family protein